MNRTAIYEFAQSLDLGPVDPSSNAEWVNFRCPLAPWTHSKGRDTTASFGIKVNDKGLSHCNCFTCKYTENFASLAYKLGKLRNRDYGNVARQIERQEFIGDTYKPLPYRDGVGPFVAEEINETSEVVELPPPEFAFRYESAIGHPYLRARGIDAFTTGMLGLRYDPFQRRILFPVHDAKRRFRGFSGRRVDPPYGYDEEGTAIERDGRPYLKVRDYHGLRKSKVLLGEHAIQRRRAGVHGIHNDGRRTVSRPRQSRLILVEGLFDYAWLKKLGAPNVLCLLGSHLARDPTRRNTIESFGLPLVMFLDNDKPGADARDKIIQQLFGRVGLLDVYYPEGYVDADPASLPASVVNQMLRDTEIVTYKPT